MFRKTCNASGLWRFYIGPGKTFMHIVTTVVGVGLLKSPTSNSIGLRMHFMDAASNIMYRFIFKRKRGKVSKKLNYRNENLKK